MKIKLGILAAIGSVVYVTYLTSAYADKQRATEEAQTFLDKFGIEFQHVECVKDGDGDGYSSCTYTEKGASKMLSLSCDTSIFLSTGCKKMRVFTREGDES